LFNVLKATSPLKIKKTNFLSICNYIIKLFFHLVFFITASIVRNTFLTTIRPKCMIKLYILTN